MLMNTIVDDLYQYCNQFKNLYDCSEFSYNSVDSNVICEFFTDVHLNTIAKDDVIKKINQVATYNVNVDTITLSSNFERFDGFYKIRMVQSQQYLHISVKYPKKLISTKYAGQNGYYDVVYYTLQNYTINILDDKFQIYANKKYGTALKTPYPARLVDYYLLTEPIKHVLVNYSYIFKDLMQVTSKYEDFSLPVTVRLNLAWNDIFTYSNLKDLYQNYFPLVSKSMFNYSIMDVYMINLLKKYTSKPLQDKILNDVRKYYSSSVEQSYFNGFANCLVSFLEDLDYITSIFAGYRIGSKRWFAYHLAYVYSVRFMNIACQHVDDPFTVVHQLYDLFNMQIEKHMKLDFIGNGVRKLKEKHDIMSSKYNLLLAKRQKLNRKVRWHKWAYTYRDFDTQNLPLTVLKKPSDIIKEGLDMRNCVGTYADMFLRQDCVILHYDDGDFKATIEVIPVFNANPKHSRVAQWFGFADKSLLKKQKQQILRYLSLIDKKIDISNHVIE